MPEPELSEKYATKHWRRKFRWVVASKENDEGNDFPSFTVASISWVGSSVMLGYYKCDNVTTVDEWLEGNTDNCLDIKMLDEVGKIQETYRLSWSHEKISPFSHSLDYESSESAKYGVLLMNASFSEVK